MKHLSSIILLVFGLLSCEELDVVNPADPNYELKAPTLLQVEALTDTDIEITWEINDQYSKEFVVSRKSDIGAYVSIGTVDENILTFTDTTCLLETEYSYIVQSKVESNLSIISNTLKTATSFPAPHNLRVNQILDGVLLLTWSDISTFEMGFIVEQDTGAGYVEVERVVSDVTEYRDTGLIFGQTFEYRVAAYTSANTSAWVTAAFATEVAAPTNLSAIPVTDSEIQLTWTDNSGYEIGFIIERDDRSEYIEIGRVGANVTEFVETGLMFGREYEYRVAAYTVADVSPWILVTASTQFASPTDLIAHILSDSEIQLTWTDNTSFEAGFRIERDDGSGYTEIGSVPSNVTEFTDSGLSYEQNYIYRVVAYTSTSTSGGATVTTNTEFSAPSDLVAQGISDSDIELSWTDNTDFESGFKIERDDGSGFIEIGSVLENVTEYTDTALTFGKNYEYRVAAHTSINTSNYSESCIARACANCFVDIDDNAYRTIQIGDQVWMAENLKVTHYREGSVISNLTSDGNWISTNSGAYSFYENNSNYGTSYGVLYNWYAATNAHYLAPEGWHIPTDAEWHTLITHLGGSSVAGGKLKEMGFDHWWSPNTDATNESGFSALPGGLRGWSSGSFISLGVSSYFWTATEDENGYAWIYNLDYSNSVVGRNNTYKRNGASIRCVRD